MAGELVKMKIVACTDSAYTEDKATPAYVVMANPEKYTIDHSIDFNLTQGQGTSSSDAKYNRTRPQTMNFDFIFDGTGILNAAGGLLGNLTNPAAISVPLVGHLPAKPLLISWQRLKNSKRACSSSKEIITSPAM